MDMLTITTTAIILQDINISNKHGVYLNYIKYISIKTKQIHKKFKMSISMAVKYANQRYTF